MTTKRMVFIGDLHLEGPLREYIDGLDGLIMREVQGIVTAASKKGYNIVVLLGDLFHKYAVKARSYTLLSPLFTANPDTQFLIIGGNHDVDSQSTEREHSLDLLAQQVKDGIYPNVKVALHDPIDLWSKTPVRMLPWPLNETRKDALNIIHLDAAGAKQDNGRDSSAEWTTDHFCISGHLHTPQRVKDIWYPGTLYQTSFGETQSKSIIYVDWTGDRSTSRVKRVPYAPPFLLHNEVVATDQDYAALKERLLQAAPTDLFKVFVHAEVMLPRDAFSPYPNVVKTNPFKTKAELKAALVNELLIETRSIQELDIPDVFESWAASQDVDPSLRKRAQARLTTYLQALT